MIIALQPCPACARHVRSDETACPFCAAAFAPAAPRPVARGRFTRAAVFAGAAVAASACGGSQKAPAADPAPDPLGNVTPDAGVAAAPDAAAPDASPLDVPLYPEPDHTCCMPYGAPPLRDRRV